MIMKYNINVINRRSLSGVILVSLLQEHIFLMKKANTSVCRIILCDTLKLKKTIWIHTFGMNEIHW